MPAREEIVPFRLQLERSRYLTLLEFFDNNGIESKLFPAREILVRLSKLNSSTSTLLPIIWLWDKSTTVRCLKLERFSVLSNVRNRLKERFTVCNAEYLGRFMPQLKFRLPPNLFLAKFKYVRLLIVHRFSSIRPDKELSERSRDFRWANLESARQFTTPDRFREFNLIARMVSQLIVPLQTSETLNLETLRKAFLILMISESFAEARPARLHNRISTKQAANLVNSIECQSLTAGY